MKKFTVDYYEALEVQQSADAALIKSNYRRLARVKHPDKNPNRPQATAEFQLVCLSGVFVRRVLANSDCFSYSPPTIL